MSLRILTPVLLLAACDNDVKDPIDTGDTTDPVVTVELAAQYDLSDAEAWPESVAWDPTTRSIYTSNLATGNITATAADGTETVFAAGDGVAGRATVGLEVDAGRRRLWACAILVDGSEAGQLWAFDLDTGDQLATIQLSEAAAGASCTDVTYDATGVAYVTDRENAAIYRVDLDDGAPTVWSDASALAPGLIGSNGIAFTPDGAFLIVSKYLPAQLVAIRVSDPSDAVVVDLDGDAFSSSGALNGADDAVFLDGTLYVTLVDELMTVVPDDDSWSSAQVTSAPLADGGVTGLTVAEGQLYASNGQAVEFTLSQPAAPFWIRRVVP